VLCVAIDAGGIAAIAHWTQVASDASTWRATAWIALRVLGIAALLLATPLLVQVTMRTALPLLGERVFLSALRSLDPGLAQRLEAQPGLPLWVGMLDSAARLARFAGLTVLLLALALVPGVGAVIAAPLQLYFTARALSWELLDPYFERRGMRMREQRRFLAEQRAALFGFGLPLALLLAVPLLGPLLFGLAQAAAAQLVHDALCDSRPAEER
jgi:hypothetical protein